MPKTRKLRWPWLLGGSLIAVCLAGLYLRSRDYVITVREPQIQERLNAAFPLEKTYLGILTVSLAHPLIRLRSDSDRVNLSVDAGVTVLDGVWRTTGTGQISGAIRYVPETRTLWLDDAQMERLDIHGLPAQYAPPVKDAAGLAAREYFDHHPLYQMKRSLFSGLLAGLALKDVVLQDGAVQITLGRSR